MESGVSQECAAGPETQSIRTNASCTEGFQKSMFELFEKNGILNDLRAYLRGHIVEVLKSTETGDPPACQKHFTQRLEPMSQAINIVIAEYLLRFEFGYSLSVFVSEIPLANMVFGFAKTLMQGGDEDNRDLRFKDADVWFILNYLGIPCDSEHAAKIVDLYKNDRKCPLLQCIVKCMPLYQTQNLDTDHVLSSEESVSSPDSSAETIKNSKTKASHRNTPHTDKCKHFVFCKTCQNKVTRIKDRCKKKKKVLAKKYKDRVPVSPQDVQCLMRNVDVIERNLIDEMFQHLKSVYETEVEMVKAEEQNRAKHSVASHSLQLQQKYAEMEESFRERETALERNVQQKKQFLWGLARALREQHDTMTRAMREVREETSRLTAKEDSLKSQLAEAEQILRQRGEEMRSQISHELTILQNHLESMKRERDSITQERSVLETLRTQDNNLTKIHNQEKQEIQNHYEIVQNELAILRKYIESLKLNPTCVIERGTTTDFMSSDVNNILNNNHNGKRVKTENLQINMNQVVNDFRKKNVNFCQPKQDETISQNHEETQSTSSEGENAGIEPALDFDSTVIQQLRDENSRLKALAIQQRSRIEQLRPSTAPQPMPRHFYNLPTNSANTTHNVGCCKGAGEELSMFSSVVPQVLVPGDTVPFWGTLRGRNTENRHPSFQYRATRPHNALVGVSKRTVSPLRERIGNAIASVRNPPVNKLPPTFVPDQYTESNSMSPVKERYIPGHEKSPNTVLREAKLRLRKLEIEAEAVEKSYLNFRRRQTERTGHSKDEGPVVNNNLEIKRSRSFHNLEDTYRKEIPNKSQNIDIPKSYKSDFDRFLCSYNKCDTPDINNSFRIKCPVHNVKPIPETYSKINGEIEDKHNKRENFLEKPLTEFRKLYQSAKPVKHSENRIEFSPPNVESNKSPNVDREDNYDGLETSTPYNKQERLEHKQAEFEMLKENINKIYHSPDNNFLSETTFGHPSSEDNTKDFVDRSLLRVEVETVELHDEGTDDNMLFVTSSVDQQVTIAERDSPSEISQHLPLSTTPVEEAVDIEAKSPEHGTKTRNEVIVNTIYQAEISPTYNGPKDIKDNEPKSPQRTESPKLVSNLTNDIFNAIFDADSVNDMSSTQVPPTNDSQEFKKIVETKEILEDSISEIENEKELKEELEYTDDFSADVDNYNSRSDGNNSPISLPKTPEDDNFWDS